MKKSLLTIVAVLFGMALSAQVSVWDGTAEPWTHGSGTPEDPYLIENAQQLAYIAQQVNEPTSHTGGYMDFFADTCFMLTTDLDLGRDSGLCWLPIGKTSSNCRIKTDFAGHFDGGGHTIYNMYTVLTDDGGRDVLSNVCFGLFGNAIGGSIRNITIASNCSIDVQYTTLGAQGTGFNIGSVLAYGEDVVLENCVNESDVKAEIVSSYRGLYCAGLFGNMKNGTVIRDCHNYGNVYCRGAVDYGALSPAGIVSYAEGCDIFGCSNSGDITCEKIEWGEQHEGETVGGIVGLASRQCNIEQCFNTGTLLMNEIYIYNYFVAASAGGIVGCASSLPNSASINIKNCYSVADISAITANADDIRNYAGGIFGTTYRTWGAGDGNNISIENCYAVGNVVSDTIGGILAKYGVIDFPTRLATVTNSYYINTIECSNGYGNPMSDEFMKSAEFVNMLNVGGAVFIMDENNANNGYPVFIKNNQHNSVDEDAEDGRIAVYPNPASNLINISLSDNAVCNSVNIYSLDGRLVKSQDDNCETVDISELSAGVYVLKLKTADGTEVSRRIVKE
jgi:hypothetical protein